MPPPRWHEQCLPGVQVESNPFRTGKKRELVQIHVVDIAHSRRIHVRVEIGGVFRRVNRVLLDSVYLRKERMNMPGVEMQNGKFPAGSSDVEFAVAAV